MKTYNFIEAIKSGKRFKPVMENNNDDYDWIDCDPEVRRMEWGASNFSKTDYDFYTSQFELEEKKITITESEFNEAWERANMHDTQNGRYAIKWAMGFRNEK